MSWLGIDAARDALDRDHGLLQQHQLGPQAHVEEGGDLEQLREQPAHRDVARPCGRTPARRPRAAPGRTRPRRGGRARSRPRSAPGRPAHSRAAGSPRGSRPGSAARRRPSRPTMPKSTAVSRAGAATNRFPSCRSAWKTPWSSAWARKARIRLSASAGRSRPGCVQRGRIGERRAGRPLQRQHPPGDALPDHRRRAHVAVVRPSPRAARRRPPPRSAGRAPAPAPGSPSRRRRAAPAAARPAAQASARRAASRAAPRRRAATRALDSRPQHLHRHLPAVDQRSRMRLGQRGGGDRLVEARRTAPRAGRPSAAATSALASLGREWRQPILQPRQVARRRSAPKMSARVERNWPSLIATGPSRSSAARQPLAGPPSAALAAREQAQGPRQRSRAGRQERVELARDQRVGADQHPAPRRPAARRSRGAIMPPLRSPSPGAGPRRRR